MKKITYLFLALLLIFSFNCTRNEEVVRELAMVDSLVKADITLTNSTFNFETTKNVHLNVTIQDLYGNALSGVYVEIYDQSTAISEDLNSELTVQNPIFRGITTDEGVLMADFPIPTYAKALFICPKYIGVPNEIPIQIQGSMASLTIKSEEARQLLKNGNFNAALVAGFQTLGPWNNLGVPSYLSIPSDLITASFLADVNSSIPESKPLPSRRPDLFSGNYTTNILLNSEAEVSITFVHEGASWTNAFGYYTYTKGNPPQKASDIKNLTIVFPNASYKNSGGGLYSGNKVNIGKFPANTVVAWFLVAQAWKNNEFTKGSYNVYSDNFLNPEKDSKLNQHSVLLYDKKTQRFVIGLEDINREKANCDNDFNDLVFYANVNPSTAVDLGDIGTTDPFVDKDKDGVSDEKDEYPTDPKYAFNNHYKGSLAYEDLWPSKGDYDFNDVVLNYDINQLTNGQNKVASIKTSLTLRASGAGFHNGFGFALPIPASAISVVNGQRIMKGLVKTATNGTEIGNSNAVIFAFDDFFEIMKGQNTSIGGTYVQPVVMEMFIDLAQPLSTAALGNPPYNPFIFANATRGREIHLPGYRPTQLADTTFFNKADDATKPSENRYYKTIKNLPWALHMPVEFAYPAEGKSIQTTYLKFTEWAESNGAFFPDWYLDIVGYRNTAIIYRH